jgi:hypothetical protein
MRMVIDNNTGTSVCFDVPPSSSAAASDSSSSVVSLFDFAAEWTDLASHNFGVRRSMSINWRAATQHMKMQRAHAPPGRGPPLSSASYPSSAYRWSSPIRSLSGLRHVIGPCSQRPLAIQYNSDDPSENLLCNGGMCVGFGAHDVQGRILAAAFTHSADRAPWCLIAASLRSGVRRRA